jgi:plasmid stabilization system protein ParE
VPQKIYRIEYLEETLGELDGIYDLHLELVGPKSARKITEKIRGVIDNLRTSPYMGMPCRNKRLAALGYRFLVCGNYLCFYLPDESKGYIYVSHILDGRTDYEKKLVHLPE